MRETVRAPTRRRIGVRHALALRLHSLTRRRNLVPSAGYTNMLSVWTVCVFSSGHWWRRLTHWRAGQSGIWQKSALIRRRSALNVAKAAIWLRSVLVRWLSTVYSSPFLPTTSTSLLTSTYYPTYPSSRVSLLDARSSPFSTTQMFRMQWARPHRQGLYAEGDPQVLQVRRGGVSLQPLSHSFSPHHSSLLRHRARECPQNLEQTSNASQPASRAQVKKPERR